MCLTTYPFQFSHTHNGDDTLSVSIFVRLSQQMTEMDVQLPCGDHESIWGSRNLSLMILNPGTKQTCGQLYAPLALPLRKGPGVGLDCLMETKNVFSLPKIKPRSLGCPARSHITLPIWLSLLHVTVTATTNHFLCIYTTS